NRLAIIDWTGVEDVRLRWASMPSDLYISGVFEGEEGSILVETYTYPDGNSLLKMEFDDEIYNISANYTLKGDILGVSANGTFVYTSLHYWMEGERNSTLNIYDISGIEARFIEGISIGEHGGFSAMFQDDRIVLVEIDHGYYYGGYGGYLLDDIAYDEVEKGSTEDSYDDDDMDDTEDSVGSEDPDNLRDGDLEDPGEIVDEPVPETNVHIINLVDGLFASDTTITLEGSYYSQRVLDDLMIMQSGSMFTALELDGDHGTVKWWSPGWISGGDVDGDLMVLAIGMYGVETIDL
ncbi:MAG: hypothetical protein U9R75_07885, partial [Candidatus Thermoplasmatota archaeon]|nr:hypothetical protein [Candidatus Thermoplasmatota archaeon]